MKIAGRGGHNPGVPGAHGILDEITENRKYYKAVLNNLSALGHDVLDVTPGNTATSGADLTYGVNKANAWGAELFISCHVNASGGSGTEVIYAPGSAKGQEYATKVNQAIAALGFKNRGAYADVRGLYEIKNTKMPCIILEPFFCDNAGDVALYKKIGADELGKAIAEGICGQKAVTPVVNKVVTAAPTFPQVDDMVLRLQRALNRLKFTDDNYQTLTEDGVLGARTKQATMKFQRIMSLTVDGIAGPNTWNQLNCILAKPMCKVDKYDRTTTKYIQYRLGVHIDGIFGSKTQLAVQNYQTDMRLSSDGIVGPDTYLKLIG